MNFTLLCATLSLASAASLLRTTSTTPSHDTPTHTGSDIQSAPTAMSIVPPTTTLPMTTVTPGASSPVLQRKRKADPSATTHSDTPFKKQEKSASSDATPDPKSKPLTLFSDGLLTVHKHVTSSLLDAESFRSLLHTSKSGYEALSAAMLREFPTEFDKILLLDEKTYKAAFDKLWQSHKHLFDGIHQIPLPSIVRENYAELFNHQYLGTKKGRPLRIFKAITWSNDDFAARLDLSGRDIFQLYESNILKANAVAQSMAFHPKYKIKMPEEPTGAAINLAVKCAKFMPRIDVNPSSATSYIAEMGRWDEDHSGNDLIFLEHLFSIAPKKLNLGPFRPGSTRNEEYPHTPLEGIARNAGSQFLVDMFKKYHLKVDWEAFNAFLYTERIEPFMELWAMASENLKKGFTDFLRGYGGRNPVLNQLKREWRV